MNGQTPRSVRASQTPRRDIDREASRYFIYRVLDAAGEPIYIGRSCDVRARLRSHYSEATHPHSPAAREAKSWIFDARSLSMLGPFTWGQACGVERAEIEQHQPRGNRMHTKAHGYYPLAEGGGQTFGRVPVEVESA